MPASATDQQAVFGSSEQPERDAAGFGHFHPRAPESEFHNNAPSAPHPRLSSEARECMRRSRPGSRPSGRRVRDEVASGGR
ncbi:hypothetical protein, partial [Nocardia asiatica]